MAIATQTLIQPQEVINGGLLKPAPLNVRFDATLIAPHIRTAEEMHLIPVIGKSMYDALITKKNNAVSNYNTALGAVVKAFPAGGDAVYEDFWVEDLLTFCAWIVYYEALPYITMQAGSNGVFVNRSEFGENVGVSGVKYLQDQAMRVIRHKANVIVQKLCGTPEDYLLFVKEEVCEGCESSSPSPEGFGVLFY